MFIINSSPSYTVFVNIELKLNLLRKSSQLLFTIDWYSNDTLNEVSPTVITRRLRRRVMKQTVVPVINSLVIGILENEKCLPGITRACEINEDSLKE